MVTIDHIRPLGMSLPLWYQVLVRRPGQVPVGCIVYLSFSRDETVMGFAFPKEERAGLVASEPEKFLMPSQSDMRYHWVHVRLDALDDRKPTSCR